MNDSDQQKNIINPPSYSTPFNVDFFLNKSAGYFTQQVQRSLSLPEPIKNTLVDLSTAEFIEENLGPAFELSAEQKANVTRIIRDVLLGDISINEMAGKISEKLGIDPTTAYQIQGKIVNELFGSVIEDIKKMQKEKFPQSSQPRYISPPPRNQTPPANPGNVVDLRNNK